MPDLRQVILCPSCGKDACGGPWPVDQVADGEHVFPCLHCKIQFIGWREGDAIRTRLRRADEPTPYFPPIRNPDR